MILPNHEPSSAVRMKRVENQVSYNIWRQNFSGMIWGPAQRQSLQNKNPQHWNTNYYVSNTLRATGNPSHQLEACLESTSSIAVRMARMKSQMRIIFVSTELRRGWMLFFKNWVVWRNDKWDSDWFRPTTCDNRARRKSMLSIVLTIGFKWFVTVQIVGQC